MSAITGVEELAVDINNRCAILKAKVTQQPVCDLFGFALIEHVMCYIFYLFYSFFRLFL